MTYPVKKNGVVIALLFGAAAAPSLAQDAPAIYGKQRAAGSKVTWDIRDAGHPSLGNIRYAVMKDLIETRVGSAKVFSRAYVSCGKENGRIAVELTNTTAPDDPGGLQPAKLPRLLCNRPTPFASMELPTAWTVSEKTGDALVHGQPAFVMRECVSVRIVQEVTLPAGWDQKTAQVEFEIHPYSKDLDSIFAACGERSAYAVAQAAAPAAAPKVAPAAPAKPAPATDRAAAAQPPPPVQAPPVQAPLAQTSPPAPPEATTLRASPEMNMEWRRVQVIAGGKTNVRAGPNLQSAIVVRLDPGSVILVQSTGTEWWRVRPTRTAKGSSFEGYIREDRLVLR